MGRRTLVVVARPGGRFDCRVAHWGVDTDPLTQSRPLGTDWPASAVLDTVDAAFEQVVVHRGTVDAYAVCWLDPTLSDPTDVALARTDDPGTLRAWWVDRKDAACRAASADAEPRAVRRDLLAALRDRAERVHLPDDASFLRGRR